MYVPGDCNILLISVCDLLCYRKKKITIRKTLRILSWINRFLNNCRKRKVSDSLRAEKV